MTTFPWLKNYPKNINWSAEIPAVPVHTIFEDSVRRYASKPAFDFLGKRYTYAVLGALVDRAARGFQDMGVRKGDKVGLFLPNCPYYPIAYYAILKIGGVVVNYNPLYAEQELIHQVTDSETDIMVTLDLKLLCDKLTKVMENTRLKTLVICSMANTLPPLKKWLFPLLQRKDLFKPSKAHHRFEQLIDNDGTITPVLLNPEKDLAVLQYTGGTTGIPKGAMLTHANIAANVHQCAVWFSGARYGEEKMMAVIPFFHVFAMTVVLNVGIKLGAEIIALPRFKIHDLLKAIHEKKPTLFVGVPTIYAAINTCKTRHKYNLSSVRECFSGGAPLPMEIKHTFEKLTGCTLVEGYGLTENSPVACVGPLEGTYKEGSIGFPLPGVVVEIVSLDDHKTLLPTGEKGEICLKGPQVMKGYWNNPDATKEILKKGRLHTGDIGYIDEDGYIFIVDRLKDLIICSGYNVYPRHVEEAIYQHPAVEECIVAGITDPYRGETVKAWIKLHDNQVLTKDSIRSFLHNKLSPMEIPKRIEFRTDPLPRTMIGKLSRKDVLDTVS